MQLRKMKPDDWKTASVDNGMGERHYPKQKLNREVDCKRTDRELVAALKDRRTSSSKVA